MQKVKNDRCIANISRKSMLANVKRNIILLVAIILTTVMLTTLFTVGSSLIKSMEISTTYQVGTSSHAGFKFLTQKEYDELATDRYIMDLSYNIIVAYPESKELNKDYTEIRYTEALNAKHGYSYPSIGKLPEKYNEIATCTQVLDDFGLPHEIGQTIHLEMGNVFNRYEGDFIVCGIWEKPASTMANQIYVSKAFQEDFSPAWNDREDYDKHIAANSYYGSINPDFNFRTSWDISNQMEKLKKRHGFSDEMNDGINWAYAGSEIDFSSVMIVTIILIMIILSGYLIINNIFLIAVTSDIHYYGLLKTIGTTNKQLKKIVLKQAMLLSIIAIPVGLLLGYVTSFGVFPFVTANLTIATCRIIPNVWIFLACALFSWFTVRISCEKPCKCIKKISPVEAVRYTDASTAKLTVKRKSKKVSPLSMAWENLKRNKRRTIAVTLSLALSIVMINVTVSIVACMDAEKYISSFANADFTITDASLWSHAQSENELDGVSIADMDAIVANIKAQEAGAIFMAESQQLMTGKAYERLVREYEENFQQFLHTSFEKDYYDQLIYKDKSIYLHIYGVDKIVFDQMSMETNGVDWEKFSSGKYAIVSAPIESEKNDSDYAFYRVGEKINLTLPNGSSKEYEVLGIGDVSYAMGPEHGHGMDIFVTIPSQEFLNLFPDSQGALKFFINTDDSTLDLAEEYIQNYCENIKDTLSYASRETYMKEFQETVDLFLVVGGALSAILVLIGIMNLVNLTYTSINERKQELKILNAVGMTNKQMSQMLSLEGILRVAVTFAIVLTLGQLLNYIIVYLMAGQMIMFSYKYVVWPMLLCIPVFTLIAAIIPKAIKR